jgi:hypothetical protein
LTRRGGLLAAIAVLAAVLAAPADAQEPTEPPVNVTPPVIAGTPRKGRTLSCSRGEWLNEPSALGWQWTRDGEPLAGAIQPTYVVAAGDVGHLVGCTVAAQNAVGTASASAADVEIVRLEVRFESTTEPRQPGPTFRVHGRLVTSLPGKAGAIQLFRVESSRLVSVGRTVPRSDGRFRFELSIYDLVPHALSFQLRFRPRDAGLYDSAAVRISIRAVSPPTYPFPRTAADRRPTLFDDLRPFWSDGRQCSIGCRPARVRAGWPLQPFHEQHALRAGLDELRGSGFHVGLDIQARDGEPVYAIESGRAHILQRRGVDERVRIGNYIYWHVVLRVHEGQWVPAYHKVVGIVMRYVRHLHFSEVRGAEYLNPLRPRGRALSPWSDREPPVIARPTIRPDGSVTVAAFDPQSFLTRTGYVTPVLAPAALAYRLFRSSGRPIGPLRWAFRGSHVLPLADVPEVFASGAHAPGFRCFALAIVCVPHWRYRLAGGLAPLLPLGSLGPDRYRLTAYAWDWDDNRTARDLWFRR